MTECIFCTDKLFKSGEVPAALCCGHVFHERCIKTWFRTRQLCPTCKQTPQVSASRRKDGIIRLFLDGAGTASPTKGAAGSGGAYPVDLTDDGGAEVPGAGEEVLLLRHNLLYAQRELDEKKREADALKSTVAGLQGALQVEADTSRSIVSQLRAAQMDLVSQLRAAQMDQRQRENEIHDLKKKMAAESEEVRQARSLRATIDAHELEKEGHHEQAIVRLVENCSSEELTVQLQKMLRLRHELCAKLEDTANDMRREIHALKAAENQRRRKEEQLLADNKILRHKLEKSRASLHDSQQAQASAGQHTGSAQTYSELQKPVRAGSPAHASPSEARRAEERIAALADSREETPKTISRGGGVGAVRTCSYPLPSLPTAANNAKSRRGAGSLVRPVQGSSLMSNDTDAGGRFIRSGPDGMGGTVHVCVQLQQPPASLSSTGQRLLKPMSPSSIACNPVGIPVGGAAKRHNTAPPKKHEVQKKQRFSNDISSFFGAAVKPKQNTES